MAFDNLNWLNVVGKRATADKKDCQPDQVVIANIYLQAHRKCLILDDANFAATGSMDIFARDGRLQMRTELSFNGDQLYSRKHLTPSKASRLAQKIERISLLLNSSGLAPPIAPEP